MKFNSYVIEQVKGETKKLDKSIPLKFVSFQEGLCFRNISYKYYKLYAFLPCLINV